MSSPTIFICGATGTQGSAIISSIHKHHPTTKIHGITRDPSSERSKALQAAGIMLSKGDFNDEDSLRTAMTGCTALFLNLMPNLTEIAQELAQANRILRVAREVGVHQIVYSSGLVTNAERRKYWDPTSFVAKIVLSKNQVEEAVRNAGFKYYTIIRPGNFMTNFLAPYVYRQYPGLAERGEFTTAFTRDTVIPMIDPNDIGEFGAAAFMDPERFHGKEIAIASELLTLDEILASMSKAAGRQLKANYMTQEEIDAQVQTNPFVGGQLMARDMVDEVDMEYMSTFGIQMGTLEAFLAREEERLWETIAARI
ncbi:hypothetical protein BDW60DRAFT_99269 [Aspergillus nidulans var. acristatus]